MSAPNLPAGAPELVAAIEAALAARPEERILRHFPEGTRVTHPSGGTVVWVQMPDAVDSIALFYEAKALRIGVAPGNIFSSCDQFKHFLRISYGHAWTPAVEQALATLGRLAHELAGREAIPAPVS